MINPLPARLAVRRLSLREFRCYSHLRLETDGRPVVLTGANGAGKTNILEALSFLAPGRGMRRAGTAEILRHGSETGAWGVAAVLDGPAGRVEIGTGKEAGSDRRAVRIDGSPAKAGDLAGLASALWLTPAMDRLFLEGASGRRRFLDRLVLGLDPRHAGHSGAYEHAMRERNRLLRAGGADRAWLTALEEAMAKRGAAVAAARAAAVQRLDQACRNADGPFPSARLAWVGEVEDWAAQEGEARAEEKFKAALSRARAKDAAAGAALLGPHRSDLAVRHGDKDMPAGQCSTGEQKAVLVSIVLAQARVKTDLSGMAPLLLLDEAAAHLDDIRRAALFDRLAGLNAQSWLTGTDEPMFAAFRDRAQFFRVADASVAPSIEEAT